MTVGTFVGFLAVALAVAMFIRYLQADERRQVDEARQIEDAMDFEWECGYRAACSHYGLDPNVFEALDEPVQRAVEAGF